MKKLFTLFAALCCVVFTAKAEAVGQKWYVTQTAGKMYELNKTYQSPAEVCAMPTGVTKVTNAIVQKPNGETKQTILYTDEPASDKVQLYEVEYDLESKSFGTPSGKFTNTDKIVPITAMGLHVYSGQIYIAGYTTTDSKYRFILSNVSNVYTRALLPSPATKTNPIVGMVIDYDDVMYVIAKGKSDANAWLYRVDGYDGGASTTATMTPLIDTKVTYQNDYSKQSLSMDWETGKLVWMTYSGTKSLFYELNLETKEVKAVGEGVDKNFSGLLHWVPKIAKIVAKVKETQEPSGYVAIGNREAKELSQAYYYRGTNAVVHAYPLPGSKFLKWSDGNTKNPRPVAVTQDTVLYAEFAWADGVTAYPIWVGGKQLHSARLTMTSSELSGVITAGSIVYNPEANVLQLRGLSMATNAQSGHAIRIGEEGKTTKLTIRLEGDASSIQTTYNTPALHLVKADVKVHGTKKLTVTGNAEGAYLTKGSTLTFEGVSADIQGSYGFNAEKVEDNDKVVIRGSNMKVTGSSIVSNNVSSITWKYCTKPTDSEAYFDPTNHKMTQGEGGADLATVTFTSEPIIMGEPYEEGTGTFQYRKTDKTGENFSEVGWFENGTKITVTAKPAKGFVIGRWIKPEDPNWGDETKKAQWWKDTAAFTKTGSTDVVQALFYAQPASSVTWYGICNDVFMSYKSRDYGANLVNSITNASSIEAGDCNGSNYYIAESGEFKRFSFSGITKDKDVNNYDKATVICSYSGSVTDMAYSFKDSRFYFVTGGEKLFRLNEGGKKADTLGICYTGDPKVKVYVTSIAIDANGLKYVLSKDNKLYTVTKEDTKNQEVTLKPVGGGDGTVNGPTVGTTPQSMAFDHISGELYWGAKGYIRKIDVKTAKSYITADLGLKKGAQGYVRALQRRDRKVTVRVEVDKDSKDMGTVSIGSGSDTEVSLFAGVEVKIVATPEEGYLFDYWTIDEDESGEKIKEATYTTSASSDTYIAHFKSAEEGIDLIDNGQWTMDNYKVLIDGNLYIIKGDKMYNVTGNRVK